MFLLVALASGALLRQTRDKHVLKVADKHVAKVFPRLQHTDVYESDFVHDDTQHPDEAVKLNIKESENRLREAREAYKQIEVKLDAAKKVLDKHTANVEAKDAEIAHAEEQVAHYNKSMTSLSQYGDKLKEAEENV